MCLRYAFTVEDREKVKRRFGLKAVPPDLKPRYNIAPTQDVPVIFNDSPDSLSEASWGITAHWEGPEGGIKRLFNARAESIDSKASFRKSFGSERCLMPADSFYEWKHPEKAPYRLYLKDEGMFSFAGIYAESRRETRSIMITTAPNELVSRIHSTNAVILRKRTKEYWKAPERKPKAC